MRQIALIAHNLRSCHNVGSLLRTADGLGVVRIYLTGYTPYPLSSEDPRLPHLAHKLDGQIHKTALGAEKTVSWSYVQNFNDAVNNLRQDGFKIVALEQSERSLPLPEWSPSQAVALVVGNETEGIDSEALELCDEVVEIPMLGQKESFNVVQAAAIGLFHIRFTK